jgi:hypothetical protein
MGAWLVQAKARDGKEWRHDEQKVVPGGVVTGDGHARRDGWLRALLRQARRRLLVFFILLVGELLRTRRVRRTSGTGTLWRAKTLPGVG